MCSVSPEEDHVLFLTVDDLTDGITEVVLYHRITGELLWNQIVKTVDPMTGSISETFIIPQDKIAVPSVEYFITAADNHGVNGTFATADTPHVRAPDDAAA